MVGGFRVERSVIVEWREVRQEECELNLFKRGDGCFENVVVT